VAEAMLQHEVVGEVLFFIEQSSLALPDDVIAGMRRFMDEAAERQQALTTETARIAGALEAAGIPAFFAKGAVWSEVLRPAGMARISKDLDFYLRECDVQLAVAVLTALPGIHDAEPDAWPAEALHHRTLWSEASGLALELHWAIAAPRHGIAFDVDGVLAGDSVALIAGRAVRVPDAIDLVHFCALELAKDTWVSLKKIADFAESVRRLDARQIDVVFEKAQGERWLRALTISLIITETLGLTGRIGPSAADPGSRRVAEICIDRLRRPDRVLSFLTRAREGLARAGKHDTLASRLEHVWRIIVVHRLRCWLTRTPQG
ncbi:MAG: nucleotidyltransferase family protein, partial [Pseudomonadota bacterium]